MSSSNNDIYNAGGPGSSAEPSMEEILASIRRILKEDDGNEAEPVDFDDDVLVLDQSMIVTQADFTTATSLPEPPPPPVEAPVAVAEPVAEALHFSSEPVPFAQEFYQPPPAEPEPVRVPEAEVVREPVSFMPPAPLPEPEPMVFAEAGIKHEPSSFEPPEQLFEPEPEPEPEAPPPMKWEPLPASSFSRYREPEPEPPIVIPEPEPEPAAMEAPPEAVEPPPAPAEPIQTIDWPEAAAPEPARAETVIDHDPEPEPEPPKAEPEMSDQQNVQPPQGLMSDKVADAAASSIGAMVRSLSAEKSVAVNRTGLTIEDIVREEIRPLLKSWLDSHLPSLVERVVRSEIERVIDRSSV